MKDIFNETVHGEINLFFSERIDIEQSVLDKTWTKTITLHKHDMCQNDFTRQKSLNRLMDCKKN